MHLSSRVLFSLFMPLAHGSFGSLDEIIATVMLATAALAIVMIYRMPHSKLDEQTQSEEDSPSRDAPLADEEGHQEGK